MRLPVSTSIKEVVGERYANYDEHYQRLEHKANSELAIKEAINNSNEIAKNNTTANDEGEVDKPLSKHEVCSVFLSADYIHKPCEHDVCREKYDKECYPKANASRSTLVLPIALCCIGVLNRYYIKEQYGKCRKRYIQGDERPELECEIFCGVFHSNFLRV